MFRTGKPRIRARRGGTTFAKITSVVLVNFDGGTSIGTYNFTFDSPLDPSADPNGVILGFCDDNVSPAPEAGAVVLSTYVMQISYDFSATTATGQYQTAANTDRMKFTNGFKLQPNTVMGYF